MRTRRSLLAPAVLAACLALPLAACGGGGGDASDDVASLGGDATTTTAAGGGGQGRNPTQIAAFEDAMLDFAECMREHGIDFPDPQTNGSGMVVIGGGIGGPGAEPPSEADRQAMQDAQAACQPILDAVQSEMPQPDPEQQEEMRRHALEFAQCMREHGIDIPDPTFDENGGIGIQIGSPDDGGPSTGPAFDPNDPDFEAAQEACGGPGGGFVTSSASVDDGGDG